MYGLNPNNQHPFMQNGGFPFGGVSQQGGRSPFFTSRQGVPFPFNQAHFGNQTTNQQGQLPFLNNRGGQTGLGNMMTTVGHVMNGINILRQLGSFTSFF